MGPLGVSCPNHVSAASVPDSRSPLTEAGGTACFDVNDAELLSKLITLTTWDRAKTC